MTGNELGLTIRAAAIDAIGSWRTLVALGRPRDWTWTAIPFLVGAWDVARGLTPGLVLALLYLLLPVWLARHGADDLGSGRSGLAPATTWLAIGVATVPLLVLIAAVANPLAAVVLAGLTALALLDGAPPVRTRDRPWIDLAVVGAASLMLALSGPAVAGVTPAAWPWLAAVAFAAWSVGMTTLRQAADDTTTTGASGTVAVVGPRIAGWFALADLVLAAVLVALLGGLGPWAALGVATYLLLPAMVIVGGATTARARAAARDAWTQRWALHGLVGAWLAVLLAWHWRLVPWDPWSTAVVVVGAAAAWSLANIVGTWLATRHRAPATAPITVPSLLIVVPCRDDADRLPACLAAIRAQTYADTSVVVVDTGSSDGSSDEAAAWIGEDDVVVAPPAPPGWEPRDWARRVGVDAAEGELILFVAPDTILAPPAARLLVEHLEATGLDLLSGMPRDLMPRVAERAAVPGFAMALSGLVPLWFPALTGGRPAITAFADSGLLLVRRSAYLSAVGQDAMPTGRVGAHLADGRRIARAFVEHGRRIGLIGAARLAGRRRAETVDATVDTWRRRTAQGGRGRLGAAIAVAIAWSLAWIAPLVLPALAVLADASDSVLLTSLVPLAIVVVARLALAAAQRQPVLSVLWHPVTVLVVLIGHLAGIVERVRQAGTADAVDADDAEAPDTTDATAADEDLDDPFGDLPDPTLSGD